MHLEIANLIGPCVVCGKLIGNHDWAAQNVIAAVQPEGVVLAHAEHAWKGPGDAEYKRTVRRMAGEDK